MDFFRNALRRGHAASAVLIDVRAESVAGAYVCASSPKGPSVLYTRRLPVEVRAWEPPEQAMLRALRLLTDILIREGSPHIRRATGHGNVDNILVAVSAPWQNATIHTEYVSTETPFVCTKKFIHDIATKETGKPDTGSAHREVIGITLNGYATRSPIGKKATQATFTIMTSAIDEHVTSEITAIVRAAYHSDAVVTVAGGPLRGDTMHTTFAHEQEVLILDATGASTTISLIRRGSLVAIEETPPTISVESWSTHVAQELATLAKQYPLPRTIFLLARESEVEFLRKALDSTELRALWLSDNPPKTIPILARHILGLVQHESSEAFDLPLLLMALYWHRSLQRET